MIRLLITLVSTLITVISVAKTGLLELSGRITCEGNPVEFAHIFLVGTQMGTISDEHGNFQISEVPAGSYQLKVSSIGYAHHSQEIDLNPGLQASPMVIQLTKTYTEMEEIVVTGTMKETQISESPVKIDILTRKFFQNNTSNNLMEIIPMVNGLQEQINCGVCGTNCIHINGMEGAYTLVLIDGMPIMSALASTYGFNGIPNSLIDRVEVIKGPSSTLYGTEAVGGVINIITRRPHRMDLVNFHAFGTSHEEYNLDLAVSPYVGSRLATTFSTNLYSNQYRLDHNQDNFTDIPLNQRLTLFNKWELNRKDHRKASLALRYYTEERFGGTMQWQTEHLGSDSIYGEFIETDRVEVIGSYQLPTEKNIRVDYSYNYHHQDSWYGDTHYLADQSIYFANFLWNRHQGKHDWILGLTTRFQTYKDNTPSYTDEREFVPGIFFQDEYSFTDRTSLLAGIRLDHHRRHGLVVAPRINLKQKIGTHTTARLNFGTGFREVHLFTEDHAFFSGARDVYIVEDLKPEQSYNVNLNLNHVYVGFLGVGTLDLDLFYNYFTNRIVPDYDQEPNLIVYDNLEGRSITNGISLGVNHTFEVPVTLRLGGTFLNAYQVTPDQDGQEIREDLLFAPVFMGTIGSTYDWRKPRMSFSWTGRIIGPQELPQYEPPFERPTTSPWYGLHNLQIAKAFNYGFEVLGGVKNIFNYTQPSPLIDPGNPFGENFDTAYAYGPLQTRRFYLGLKWNLRRGK